MGPCRLSSFALLAVLSLTTAHFSIKSPEQNEPSDESQLERGPCGGAALDFSSKTVSDFHVGGDAIALRPTHPQQNWLFRATTDTTGGGNWTQIFPIIMQGGLGEICEPDVSIPQDWAGKQGLIGVVANAEDGVLYGCSQVKFVEGKASGPPDSCRNTTKEINFTSDDKLATLVSNSGSSGGGGNNGGSGGSPSGSGTQGATSPTKSPGAASSIYASSISAGLVGAVAMVVLGLIGGAGMI